MKPSEKKFFVLKKAILAALQKEDADFDLYLMTNSKMNALRRQLIERKDFKGKEARKIAAEKMVSVLSFAEPKDFPSPESPKSNLGEVYLNLDFEKEIPGKQESLLVHGVLHLLGYQHDNLRDTIKMEALEKKICGRLKIPQN